MYLTVATAPGTGHINPGKPGKINNQDALAIRQYKDGQVIVLCDGCGSQPYSGTGADIGANIIANIVRNKLFTESSANLDWEDIVRSTVKEVTVAARVFALGGSVPQFEQAVVERFLFTAMVLITNQESAIVASFGDGVVVCDDEVLVIDPPILNAPAYLGYLLLQSSAYHSDEFKGHLSFKVVKRVAVSSIQKSLIIGTDGLKDLVENPIDVEILHHPTFAEQKALQQWLNAQTSEKLSNGSFVNGKCSDDVSLAIFRSDESQGRLLEARRELLVLKKTISALQTEINGVTSALRHKEIELDHATTKALGLETKVSELRVRTNRIGLLESEVGTLKAAIAEFKDKSSKAKGWRKGAYIESLIQSFFKDVEEAKPIQPKGKGDKTVKVYYDSNLPTHLR